MRTSVVRWPKSLCPPPSTTIVAGSSCPSASPIRSTLVHPPLIFKQRIAAPATFEVQEFVGIAVESIVAEVVAHGLHGAKIHAGPLLCLGWDE